jgi:hypothetical protein
MGTFYAPECRKTGMDACHETYCGIAMKRHEGIKRSVSGKLAWT